MKAILPYDQDIFSHPMRDIIKDLIGSGMADQLMFPGYVSLLGIIWYYLGVLLFIMLIQYFFSNTLKKAADRALHHTLRAMTFGLLFFILVPVLIFLLMATLLGIPLGLLILIAYVTVILLVVFISSVSVANWMNRMWKRNWGFWILCSIALVVFLALNLLLMVPVLGWIVLGMLSCLAFGSILLNINWKITKQFGQNINL